MEIFQSNNRRARSLRRVQLKKKEQLGLAIGTASYRLRKMIVFQMVQELGRDQCFRCEQKIESANDLVFDHKVPWLDNSPDLFWEASNVAFSHAACNIRAARRGECNVSQRRVGPEETAWCCGHQEFLPVERFSRNRSHWNGLAHECKTCYAAGRAASKMRARRWAGKLFSFLMLPNTQIAR
jgi:hypothetical protein